MAKTKVVNWMIMHILRMYNSKHPSHGMRVFPMLNIAKTKPYIAQLTTTPFRWGWDSNHWVPLMLHYPLWPPRLTHPLLQMNLKNPPGSLSGSNKSANSFSIFYRNPIPSTRNAMINMRCHISFRWETKFGCTCRKKALQVPIEISPTPLWNLHHHQGCG
jgi:hypothetical protein